MASIGRHRLYQLLQPDFQSDPFNGDPAGLEWACRGEALELSRRVSAADRYEIRINSGVVQLNLDQAATPQPLPQVEPEHSPVGAPVSALEILLDGVESRARSRG